MGYKSRRTTSRAKPSSGGDGEIPSRATTSSPDEAAQLAEASPPIPVLPLHETIRRAIQVAVTVHPSLRAAARALEMPPSSLRDKLDQFGINMPGSRPNRTHPCQPAFTMRPSRTGHERAG